VPHEAFAMPLSDSAPHNQHASWQLRTQIVACAEPALLFLQP